MAKKISIENASEFVRKEGYTLLNKEINSNKDKLLLICPRGHNYSTSYANFQSNNRRCTECKKIENGLINYYTFKKILESENYTLLVEESPLLMKDKCDVICSEGHDWSVSFTDFKLGTRCNICSGNVKLSQEEVEQRYLNEGYTLISKYINSATKVVAICPNNHNWEHLPSNFQRGQRCFDCFGAKKRTLDDAKQAFVDKGFIPKFESYKDNKQMLPFICPVHEDYGIQHARLVNMERGLANCRQCYLLLFTGENSSLWKGGKTTINKYLRDNIFDDWIKPSLKASSFKCVITKASSELEVHHLFKNFSDIVEEIFENTKIPMYTNIGDYSTNELKVLKDTCISLHIKYGLGITLHKKVHRLFHNLYGYQNNTIEQFKDFQNRYENGEFEGLFYLNKEEEE